MNTATHMDESKEILMGIIGRCQDDENFKNKMMNTPVAAIEEYTGKKYKLPENKEFKVTDQSDEKYIYINIPRKLTIDDLELTDEELEQVAGGGEFWLSVGAGLLACAIYDFGNGIYDGIVN